MFRTSRIRSAALATLIVALVLALAVSLRGGSGSGTAFAAATAAPADALGNAQRTLTFTGSGDVQLQPDTANVNVSVHGDGGSSDAALAVATGKMEAVLAALKALDAVHITDADLETQGVGTSPDWEHEGRYVSDQSLCHHAPRPGPGRRRGRRCHGGRRRFRRRPVLSLDQQTAAYRDALRSALADARSKADAAAGAMGVKILGTSTIVENSGGGGPIMYAADAAAKSRAGAAPPVKIGPVTVSAQVTVTYIYDPPPGG